MNSLYQKRINLAATLVLGAGVALGETGTLAEKISAAYGQINTVSCLVRKTTEIQGQTANMLSRVYYERPDRLHVENVAPFKRRIIADGTHFYFAQDGQPKGYSVPLPDLAGEWKIIQQSIPGTAMEHLLRLQGVPEEPLEPLPDLPVRRGYRMEKLYVALACDGANRLARIEFFKDHTMAERTALYQYSNFTRVSDDCFLAALQQAEVTIKGETLRETKRFDNLQVNQPIAPGLFDAQAFYKGVEFVSDFAELE